MRKDWNSFSKEVDNKNNKILLKALNCASNRYAQSLYWCHIADAGGPLSCLAGVEVNGRGLHHLHGEEGLEIQTTDAMSQASCWRIYSAFLFLAVFRI